MSITTFFFKYMSNILFKMFMFYTLLKYTLNCQGQLVVLQDPEQKDENIEIPATFKSKKNKRSSRIIALIVFIEIASQEILFALVEIIDKNIS